MSCNRYSIMAAAVCLLPVAAWSASPTCPNLDEVLAANKPAGVQVDTNGLANAVGAASGDDAQLAVIAGQIEKQMPQAKQADVADILTAAYCRFLVSSSSQDNLAASVRDFAARANDSVITGNAQNRVSTPQPSPDWIVSNFGNG